MRSGGRAALVVVLVAMSLTLVPGAPAGAATTITEVTPGPIAAGTPTPISARVVDPGPGGVTLERVVGFGTPQTQPMADDGQGADSEAGDGTYSTSVPAQLAGTLVRFRVVSGAVAVPEERNGRRYDGFVVSPTPVATALPVLDWFIAPADYTWLRQNPGSKQYRPAVLVADGTVYDGVLVRPQGGLTAQQGPKPNFKLKLPEHTPLGAPYFAGPVDELVLDADYEDPTYSVNVMANELYARHGAPPRQVTTARIQRNGTFHGVYQMLEEMDGEWRDRAGFDVASVYEGESTRAFLIDEQDTEALESHFSVEHPDDSDLADLALLAGQIDGVASDQRPAELADAFDLPQVVEAAAVATIVQNWDSLSGNWSLLRDEDTDRWRMIPNDLDLAFGLRGRTRNALILPLFALGTLSPLYADDRFAQMFYRRLRTLLDTELTSERILGRLDGNTTGIAPDVALDRQAWPLATPSLATGRADVADYVAFQRAQLLAHQRDGELPAAQAGGATVAISEIRAVGDPTLDFVELGNPSTTAAVDVSGWTIGGAAEATLPGGSVIPAGDRIVVPVDPRVMAERGEGIAVAGRLAAALPDAGGTLVVRSPEGTTRDTVTWSASGTWPDQAGGSSIEADGLGPDRAFPEGWRGSEAVGGSPGRAGPSGSSLTVDVWSGRWGVPPGQEFEVRVSVTNTGETPIDAVQVASSVPACVRSVGTVPAGESRSWWCPVRLTSPRASEAVTVRAVSSQASAVDGDAVTVVDDVPAFAGPRLQTVTMADDGALRLAYTDPSAPGAIGPSVFHRWRTEAHVSTRTSAAPTSHLVPPTAATLGGLTLGVPASVRVTSRSVLALGAPSARAPGIAPRPEEHWPHASTRALVASLYREVGGRPASTGELDLWTVAIDDFGVPPAQLAADLLAEPRWRTTATTVARLYLAVLGRSPDAGGLAYWIGERERGMSLPAMAEAFARSGEFRQVYGSLGDVAFVDRVYRNVLRRGADVAGRAYWVERLRTGTSRGGVVLGFSQSPEGVSLLGPAATTSVTWYALTGVAPTAVDRADATAWLAAGGSPLTVVDAARSSDAYASAVG